MVRWILVLVEGLLILVKGILIFARGDFAFDAPNRPAKSPSRQDLEPRRVDLEKASWNLAKKGQKLEAHPRDLGSVGQNLHGKQMGVVPDHPSSHPAITLRREWYLWVHDDNATDQSRINNFELTSDRRF